MDNVILLRYSNEVRQKLGADDNSPIDIISLANSYPGLTLVFFPFDEEISGICVKSANLIAINSNSTLGRQSFSIAHELYHYFFDKEKTTISYIVDKSNSKVEKDANTFASYLLMPDSTFTRFCNKLTNNRQNNIELKHILDLEQYFKVSRNAVLIRLIQDGYISKEESEQYKIDIIKNAKKYGYDVSLYLPSETNKLITYGSYLKYAMQLKNLGLISNGKYEEYLLEAFRDDIVFDNNSDKEIYD